MKQIKSKLYINFFSLFIIVFILSLFAVITAFQTYQENQELRGQSLEVGKKLFHLEQLTSDLNFLGQRHILTESQEEMEHYNQRINATYYELDELIDEVSSTMEQYGDNMYKDFNYQWDIYWSTYEKAIESSHEYNNLESQRWLIKANDEFVKLDLMFLQPLIGESFQLISEQVLTQNHNNQRLLILELALLIIILIGFITTLYYLQKIIKKSEELSDQLEFLAYHDELTQLPNRRMFQEQVNKEILESDKKAALMYLDMDKFKYINDNFGHETGDLVIKAFSHRVKGYIRNSDILGRQGGDEFTILLKEIDEDKVAEIATRIIESFKQPLRADGKEFHISTSIGIAIYPDNGREYQPLLKNADNALYEAKRKRNSFVISDATS